jgi:hypothetical protein
MAMRTDDRQVADFSVEPTGDVAGNRVGGKKAVVVEQSHGAGGHKTWLTSWTINNGVVLERSDH